MPCPSGPRKPGQFCSGLTAPNREAYATAGSAIREFARNDRRGRLIEFTVCLIFIAYLPSHFARNYADSISRFTHLPTDSSSAGGYAAGSLRSLMLRNQTSLP